MILAKFVYVWICGIKYSHYSEFVQMNHYDQAHEISEKNSPSRIYSLKSMVGNWDQELLVCILKDHFS